MKIPAKGAYAVTRQTVKPLAFGKSLAVLLSNCYRMVRFNWRMTKINFRGLKKRQKCKKQFLLLNFKLQTSVNNRHFISLKSKTII